MFIDISKWNGKFDWNKALAMGVEGAYIKSSEGLYTDSLFKRNSANCPLKWRGAYHFLYYGTGASGAKQAEYVVNLLKGWKYNLPVALDIEPGNYDIPFELNAVLKIAMEFVEQYKELTGHNPVIYVSSGRTQEMSAFTDCPLWVAHYTQADKPTVYSWSEYVLWQYSSTGEGKLYGNEAGNRHIDLNRIGKPIGTWAIGDPFDKPPETQPGIFKAQCTADRLIIRNAPYIATETDTGKRLSHGDIREVTKVQGDWYTIADGWVSALYMARISEPAGLTLEERVADLEKRVTALEAKTD